MIQNNPNNEAMLTKTSILQQVFFSTIRVVFSYSPQQLQQG